MEACDAHNSDGCQFLRPPLPGRLNRFLLPCLPFLPPPLEATALVAPEPLPDSDHEASPSLRFPAPLLLSHFLPPPPPPPFLPEPLPPAAALERFLELAQAVVEDIGQGINELPVGGKVARDI